MLYINIEWGPVSNINHGLILIDSCALEIYSASLQSHNNNLFVHSSLIDAFIFVYIDTSNNTQDYYESL